MLFQGLRELNPRSYDTAVIGRPYILAYKCTRTSLEWVVMELLLQHPKKTIAELFDELYQETGSEYACLSSLLFETKQYNAKEG